MTQVNLSSDAMTLEQDEATEAIGAARRVIRRERVGGRIVICPRGESRRVSGSRPAPAW